MVWSRSRDGSSATQEFRSKRANNRTELAQHAMGFDEVRRPALRRQPAKSLSRWLAFCYGSFEPAGRVARPTCEPTVNLSQPTTDEELIVRVGKGDRLAMQALYARYSVRVYRFVLRLVHNQATAEDVTGDTFLDVWRQATRFEGRSAVSTWILSIARFKALSSLRRRSEQELDEERVAELEDDQDTPAVAMEKRDSAKILRQCMEALSAEHREVIDLVYYHEKSVEEVARIVGSPEATVKTRMFYARKRLSELLKAKGVDRGWP